MDLHSIFPKPTQQTLGDITNPSKPAIADSNFAPGAATWRNGQNNVIF